jgi:ABC-type uncharacterized transport system substrate-binding protein
MTHLPFITFCMALALAPLGGRAWAHPHVFIDAALAFVFDDEGRIAALRVGWSYDDFYSLVMIEDNGLDADGDGTPEAQRLDAFAGHDVDWAAGFPGDLSLMQGDKLIALAPPVRHTAQFEGGRIITSHVRPLVQPLAITDALIARIYDPSFFAAYDVPALPVAQGRDGCRITRAAADTDRAYQEYGDKLASVDVTGDPFQEVDLGDIGILFADAFGLVCDAPS